MKWGPSFPSAALLEAQLAGMEDSVQLCFGKTQILPSSQKSGALKAGTAEAGAASQAVHLTCCLVPAPTPQLGSLLGG